MHRIRLLGILLVTVSLSTALVSADDRAARFEPLVNHIVESFNAGDYNSLRRDFNDDMAAALPTGQTVQFFGTVMAEAGSITDVGEPTFPMPSVAEYPITCERSLFTLQVALDADDKVAGLRLKPRHEEPPDVPAQNQVSLRLPFDGRWYVYWGGDTEDVNYHVHTPNQRHAFDMVIVDDRGSTHSGDGSSNKDYYCFGKKLLAPADGVVTDVINGVRDNEPGTMNPYSALGNTVIIKHSDNEYSVLAHLKYAGVMVAVGDSVKQGAVIGLCGNSGNSSEAHLHYHMQHTNVIPDGIGIKCIFDSVVVVRDGDPETRVNYSPVQGDMVGME
ncbi:peptidoglycan DD-metalloendopeptidase family protein [candidate division GN15 bacterium]|nr:peptidoglycan DD-metalloendopeptidase family protein [candidate division GN15 bacterium]